MVELSSVRFDTFRCPCKNFCLQVLIDSETHPYWLRGHLEGRNFLGGEKEQLSLTRSVYNRKNVQLEMCAGFKRKEKVEPLKCEAKERADECDCEEGKKKSIFSRCKDLLVSKHCSNRSEMAETMTHQSQPEAQGQWKAGWGQFAKLFKQKR